MRAVRTVINAHFASPPTFKALPSLGAQGFLDVKTRRGF